MMTIVFGTLVLAVAAVAAVVLIAFLDVAFHPPAYSLAAVRKENTLSSLRKRDLFAWFSETAQSMTRSLISARRDARTGPLGPADSAQETFDVRACSSRTAATPEEILEIAGYLRQTQSPETVEAIRRQAGENSRVVAEEDAKHTCAGHRCPLLCEDGTCMALPVRPIQCRVRCEMLGRAVPFADDERARVILDGTEAGVSQALNESGGSSELYELNSGLGRVLSVPDAAEKWESGENLFAECLPYRECAASAN